MSLAVVLDAGPLGLVTNPKHSPQSLEAKWAELVGEPRALKSLLAVRDIFGDRAADEHWVACRTSHPHAPPGLQGVRLIDAASFGGWFDCQGLEVPTELGESAPPGIQLAG